MERSVCSFSSFNDKIQCGRNINIVPSEKCLPLNNCKDDIQQHLRSCNISLATLTWEYELIKERAGFFDETLDTLIICPNHRFMIGKGWRRSRLCMAKEPLPHCFGKHKASNTSISIDQSRRIWRQYGILIEIGSGFCRQCRGELYSHLKEANNDITSNDNDKRKENIPDVKIENTMPAHFTTELLLEIEKPVHILHEIEIDDQHSIGASSSDYCDNNTEYTLSQTSEGSVWTPTASQEDDNSKKRKALDSFLITCGASPVKKTLTADWRGCSERTKSDYITKTTKVLSEILNFLVPGQESIVLDAIMESKRNSEESLLNVISAAYIGCEDWGSQRQILSIVAHKVSYSELHALIPDLSRYKYGAARKHALSAGSGQKVPPTETTHEGITTEQINNFLDFIMSPAIITDIPFGESNLKLSNGEIISVPKIILNSVRTRVVQQYLSYCEEINYEKKGSLSSYMRILHAIGPNVRKSMKGLDNYAADGAKAIENLQKAADLFGRLSKGKEWQDSICKLLTASKQYLKLEYKTHVVKESEVADHCCTFALSDGTKDYTSSCSHLHQNSCRQCEELDTVLECLMEVSKTINYDNDDQKDDTMYTVSEGVRAVQEWKKHILRSVNQDMARKSVIENLKEDEKLVERDWAMKFIPMQYRESQSNWFGKRGLNWHVSVATFKYRDAPTMHTVIHIFDSAPQDADTSNAVLGNSLEIFHQINSTLTTAYIRSDNAGCFHGATSVCAMPFLSSMVHCERMDFADPQGGKSICDRKAAHVKSYIRRYVNEGNDVCTAMDFKNALKKSNIKKVSVVVALQPSKTESKKKEPAVFKLPKITTVNNFAFKNGGVQVWRQFEIGQGCHIPAVDATRDLPELTIIDTFLNQQTETEVRQSGTIETEVPVQEPVTQVQENVNEVEQSVSDNVVTTDDQSNDNVDAVSEDEMSKLFSCKECFKTFSKYGNLLRHLDFGKHSVKQENKKLSDKSKIEYSRHMEKVNTVTVNLDNVSPGNYISDLPQGWALKSRRTVKRFTQDQKKYLEEKFDRGEKTGQKFDPEEVSQDMRIVRTTNGRKRFSQEEFLSATQIASYFSRPLYTADDVQAETAEAEFIELNLVAA